jgi:isopentenyldiphosphate isomerase
MAGRIAVVDAQNHFVRWEDRRTIHEQQLPHRSVHLFLLGPDNRLLVQRRHHAKQTFAGFLDGSVAGHVEESDYPAGPDERLDEVYREVAARELTEELGIEAPFEHVGTFAPAPGLHYEHFQLFLGRHPGPFVLQPDEVEEVRWVSPGDLEALDASGEKITPLLSFLAGWLQEQGRWGGGTTPTG